MRGVEMGRERKPKERGKELNREEDPYRLSVVHTMEVLLVIANCSLLHF